MASGEIQKREFLNWRSPDNSPAGPHCQAAIYQVGDNVVLVKSIETSVRFVVLSRRTLKMQYTVDVSPMRIFAVGNDVLAVVTADGDAGEQLIMYTSPTGAVTKAKFEVPRGAHIALTDEHLCVVAIEVRHAWNMCTQPCCRDPSR
jgi:uncharacterized protein YfaP (DUF2135 family)